MWLRTILSACLICLLSSSVRGQALTYQFVDPCTKQVTFFSVPASGTTIFFLGQSKQFTPTDVMNGAFASWIDQVYTDYRKITPCSQQSGQVTQNQIISQTIGSTVQSVTSSVTSQAQSSSIASNNNVSKGNRSSSEKKPKTKKDVNSNVENNSFASSDSKGVSGSSNSSGSNTSNGNVNSGYGSNSNNNTGSNPSKESSEVAATTLMNNDAREEKPTEVEDRKKESKSRNSRQNPIIVQSDLTTAQNLDKSFTPILNLGVSRSSLTGATSWGLTSMTWLNFKQFAISGRYTKLHFSKTGSVKYIHNLSLTGVYTYGNLLSFFGYSGILNLGTWGVTGFNLSASGTLVSQENNTYLSPSFTAFYTRPFKSGDRLTISPEIYIISTPLIYSSKEKITTTDRTFGGFLGSGFDYKLTKRFKINVNYKANVSTNPKFPILSFFLIGSKINL